MNRIISTCLQNSKRLPASLRRNGFRGTVYQSFRRISELTDQALVGPRVLRFVPTIYLCNHKCPMCNTQAIEPSDLKQRRKLEVKNRMGIEGFKTLLDSIPPGLKIVEIIGGGEPFMHPDCLAMMVEIKKRGLEGNLMTNGTLLREKYARKMVEIGWDQIRVSVNASDRETYQKVHAADHFEQLQRKLKMFSQIRKEMGAIDRVKLRLYFALQMDNVHLIKDMFAYAEDVAASFIEFEVVQPSLNTTCHLTPDQNRKARDIIRSAAQASGIPCNLDVILDQFSNTMERQGDVTEEAPEPQSTAPTPPPIAPLNEQKITPPQEPLTIQSTPTTIERHYLADKQCVIGFHQALVWSTGEVFSCCFSHEVLGNVLETPFNEIWFGQKFKRLRQRLMNGKFPPHCFRFAKWCLTDGIYPANRPIVSNAPIIEGVTHLIQNKIPDALLLNSAGTPESDIPIRTDTPVPLEPGTGIEFCLTPRSAQLSGIQLRLGTYCRVNQCHITVKIGDSPFKFNAAALIDNQPVVIRFPAPIECLPGHPLKITIFSEDATAENVVALWCR